MTISLQDPTLIKTQVYIDGVWVDADSGETLPVTNPANGEVLALVPRCAAAETRRMIEAAARAQSEWAKTTVKQRAILLRIWYNLMLEHQQDLATLLTAEQGKPLAEARGEVLAPRRPRVHLPRRPAQAAAAAVRLRAHPCGV